MIIVAIAYCTMHIALNCTLTGALACDEMRSLLRWRGRMNLHSTAEADCATQHMMHQMDCLLPIAHCLLHIVDCTLYDIRCTIPAVSVFQNIAHLRQ